MTRHCAAVRGRSPHRHVTVTAAGSRETAAWKPGSRSAQPAGDRTTDRRVLLVGRCQRKRHLVFQVVDTADGLVVEAPRFAAGRPRTRWTPLRRKLEDSRIERYGCSCGRSELIPHAELRADVGRGVTEWIIAGTSIARRRRSGMGESASG
jgi:hypothetical protein